MTEREYMLRIARLEAERDMYKMFYEHLDKIYKSQEPARKTEEYTPLRIVR